MSKRVGVLTGGWGEEKDISVKSGSAVAAALSSQGHTVTRILAGPGLDRALRASQVDVVFNALHGRMGEDGRVQGLLEVLGLPYTGSGVLASALAMNKTYAKKLFRLHNLPTPSGYSVKPEHLKDLSEFHGDMGVPVVVKPANGGSSVGLTLVERLEELPAAVEKACRFGGEALVERRIEGREVTVAILGDEVLGSCEIAFDADTFDFASKYQGKSKIVLPPRLSVTRLANIERLALSAYRVLGCRGGARVDLLASEGGDNDVLLEVNTLPGMTQTSLLPRIAKQAGLSFEALCERLLSLAHCEGVQLQPAPHEGPQVAAPALAAG